MSTNRLDALKGYILSMGWRWSQGSTNPFGEQIFVHDGPHRASVNYYPKKQRCVIGGSASTLRTALQQWVNALPQMFPGSVSDSPAAHVSDFHPSILLNDDTGMQSQISSPLALPHIGMDEAGKGDWFGPLVVAAVFVNDTTEKALRELKIRDSKEVMPSVLLTMAQKIKDIVSEQQRVVLIIKPYQYNMLYEQHHNINLVLAQCYAQGAFQIFQTSQCSSIVCDQFSQRPERLELAFAANHLPVPRQLHHAEEVSIAVAAASILASAAFTESLLTLGIASSLESPLPKGSSNVKVLQETVQKLILHDGIAGLNRYVKLHFAPIQQLINAQSLKEKNIVESETPSPMQITYTNSSVVEITQPIWHVRYHSSGFYRFTFADGGLFDWYALSTGRIDVRGKLNAPSTQKLKERAHGIIHGPATKEDMLDQKLISLKKSVEKLFPNHQAFIPKVYGIAWKPKETMWGKHFLLSDGAILCCYPTTGKIVLQGKPQLATRETLEALCTFSWSVVDILMEVLKQIFPDWDSKDIPIMDESQTDSETWIPLTNSLKWESFWPQGRDYRRAANERSACQHEFLEDWASILAHHQEKRHLLVQAPTGLGKTIASLVPALAWIAQVPSHRRVYYLVNRLAQHENPLQEIKKLGDLFSHQTNQKLRVVDLVGKQQLCLYPQAQQLSEQCKNSTKSANWKKLPTLIASWEEVKEHFEQAGNRDCPYHTLQKLMASAHIVICDYWWLFSQTAQERDLSRFAGISATESIIIVDEAHNLPEHVRNELSIEASTDQVKDALHQINNIDTRKCVLDVVRAAMYADRVKGINPSQILSAVGGKAIVQLALQSLVDDNMYVDELASLPERILRLVLQPDENVVIYPERVSETQFNVCFRLVNPLPILQEGYLRIYSSLSMSGTLAAPADDSDELRYQLPLFGLALQDTLTRVYASPFPLVHQQWIYTPDTYGIVSERKEHIKCYVNHIRAIGRVTPGVTAVFFSSYDFLEMVRDAIVDTTEQTLIISESSGTSTSVLTFDRQLREIVEKYQRAYLFAIYKGKIAEGANFSGNLIKTILCVSLPVERFDLYYQKLESLYSQKISPIALELKDSAKDKAHEYAWYRSCLSLILQACGRGIRHQADRCTFVLIDKRYDSPAWRQFLDPKPFHLLQPEEIVKNFHQDRSQVENSTMWDEALLAYMGRGVLSE